MISQETGGCPRYRFSKRIEGKEAGRASLIIITNELEEHRNADGSQQPYALLEDVFVHDEYRGKGLAVELIKACITQAKKIGCYKLIAVVNDAEPHLHRLYWEQGLIPNNKEYRLDLPSTVT